MGKIKRTLHQAIGSFVTMYVTKRVRAWFAKRTHRTHHSHVRREPDNVAYYP